MRTVFDVVELHPAFDASVAGPGFGNIVVIDVASNPSGASRDFSRDASRG